MKVIVHILSFFLSIPFFHSNRPDHQLWITIVDPSLGSKTKTWAVQRKLWSPMQIYGSSIVPQFFPSLVYNSNYKFGAFALIAFLEKYYNTRKKGAGLCPWFCLTSPIILFCSLVYIDFKAAMRFL